MLKKYSTSSNSPPDITHSVNPCLVSTLPSTRSIALRDDSTLYIKSIATPIPSNPPAAFTPTPVAQATAAATTAPTQPYPTYSYNSTATYHTEYQFKAPKIYYFNAYTLRRRTSGSHAAATTVLTSGGAGGAAKLCPATGAGVTGMWPVWTTPAPGYAAPCEATNYTVWTG
ncbi:hypothetical protein V8B97DRAFT_2015951 [Scleroderma yunnanense]